MYNMLSVRLKDFLVNGPIHEKSKKDSTNLTKIDTLNEELLNIQNDSEILLSEWNNYKEEELKKRTGFENVLNEIHEFQSKTMDTDLFS